MADWYVSPTGAGNMDGTSEANAWAGFDSVVWGDGGVRPGDTLHVFGDFTTTTVSLPDDPIYPVIGLTGVSGVKGQHIVIAGDLSTPWTINGNRPTETHAQGLQLMDCHYLTIIGFDIADCGQEGYFIGRGSSNIVTGLFTIDGCGLDKTVPTASDNNWGGSGMELKGTTEAGHWERTGMPERPVQNIFIFEAESNNNRSCGFFATAFTRDITFFRCRADGNCVGTGGYGLGAWGGNVNYTSWTQYFGNIYYTALDTTRWSDTVYAVANNEAWLTQGRLYSALKANEWCVYDGYLYINLGGAVPSFVKVQQGYAENIRFIECEASNTVSPESDSCGIQFDDWANGVMIRCRSHDNKGWGFNTHRSVGALIIGCLSYNNSGVGIRDNASIGTKIYNNVCWNNQGSGISLDVESKNAEVKNNICKDNNGYGIAVEIGAGTGYVIDNNCYHNNELGDLFQATDDNGIFADPRFVNPTAVDFRLSGASPCRGAGLDLGSDYDVLLHNATAWMSNILRGRQTAGAWNLGIYVDGTSLVVPFDEWDFGEWTGDAGVEVAGEKLLFSSTGLKAVSEVFDLSAVSLQTIDITTDGDSVIIEYRGSASSFAKDDAVIPWMQYTGTPVDVSADGWKYLQIRITS